MEMENEAGADIIERLLADVCKDDASMETSRAAVLRVRERLEARWPLKRFGKDRFVGNATPSTGFPRRSRVGRLRSPFAMAALAVGVLCFWQWGFPSRSGTGLALGDVLARVRTTPALGYTAIETHPEWGEDVIAVRARGTRWLRLVSIGKGTRVFDFEQAKLLHYDHPNHPGGLAVLYTFTGSKAEALREVEIAMTTIIRLAPSDAESLGKREIMGRQATGFRVERASLVDDINDISIWEVWADPETAALVRVEIRHARSEGRVTLLDFDYDGASDLGEFRLEPPAGYVLVEESVGELGE